jgi:hypothetical protein
MEISAMKTSTLAVLALGVVATGVAGVLAGLALATGAPTVAPLTWAGTVADKDGKPYPTAVDVQMAFYDKAEGGKLKCSAPPTKAEAATGRFEVVLPGECVAAVHETPDLWSQATVGSGATQQVMPRTHVGAVPYALEADSAKVATAAGGGLKASVDGLLQDVAALKLAGNKKAKATVVPVEIGKSAQVQTAGGQLVIVFSAPVKMPSFEGGWQPMSVKLDGVVVGTSTSAHSSDMPNIFHNRIFAVADGIPAGAHQIGLDYYAPGTCVETDGGSGKAVPCTVTVIEL